MTLLVKHYDSLWRMTGNIITSVLCATTVHNEVHTHISSSYISVMYSGFVLAYHNFLVKVFTLFG